MDTLDDASIYRICEQSDLIALKRLRQTSKKIREACSRELLEVKVQELANYLFEWLVPRDSGYIELIYTGYPDVVHIFKYESGEIKLDISRNLRPILETHEQEMGGLIPNLSFSVSTPICIMNHDRFQLTGRKNYYQYIDYEGLIEDMTRLISLPNFSSYQTN